MAFVGERRDVRAPLVAVSPHLDDAVLGCGALLAHHPGAVVVTVFAGRPPAGHPLTPWDEAAGFRAGDDIVGARRAEDLAALRRLRARPAWLDFLDAQYGDSPAVDTIAAALEHALHAAEPATVCIPLGLFHSDHALVHAAAITLLPRHGDWRWVAYEEPMYRLVPDLLPERLASLRNAGVTAVPLDGMPTSETKRDAIACYTSQLRALAAPTGPGYDDALAPERYWALSVE
jgi:LmbE family N-acetylglucosaminyl deacetylase